VTASTERRELIDVAVEACTGSPPDAEYALVTTDSVELGSLGVLGVVEAAINSRRLYRTAKGLAEDNAGLQTLVLARLSGGGTPRDLWVFDGWSLLRSRGEYLNLRGALLRGAQLRGARMKGADIEDADLSGADLEKADLSTANMTGACMAGSSLLCANLFAANLTEAELCRADLRHADLREAICIRTAFRGADLWNAYMWNVDVSHAFTAGADLERADYLNNAISYESRITTATRETRT
jgi:uncharacterized protein YjbI with pentapeptide repeats